MRDLEPVDQIAYTWFEYRLPERSDSEHLAQWQRLDRLGGHLLHVRGETAFSDPRLRLTLAGTLAAVTLYGPAFNEIRSVLDEHPEDEGALRLGGELIVRHKLGILRYRGDEYLTGFREPPVAASLQPHEVVDLALAAEVGEQTSTLYTMLGSAWLGERRLGDAMIATRMAVALDPSNGVARDNLQQLEIIARRQ